MQLSDEKYINPTISKTSSQKVFIIFNTLVNDDNESEDNKPTFSIHDHINELFEDLQLNNILVFNIPHMTAYLIAFPEIIDILKQLPGLLHNFSNKNTQISLELYQEPEFDDEYPTIYIRQKSYEEDILDKIDEINQLIEPDLLGMSVWLLVNTDFQPFKS